MKHIGMKLFLLSIIPPSISLSMLFVPIFLPIVIVLGTNSLSSNDFDYFGVWLLQLSIWVNFVIFVYWLNFLFFAKLFLPIFYENFLLSLKKKISLLQKFPISVFVLLVAVVEYLTFISFAPPYRFYCLLVISCSFGLYIFEYLLRIFFLKNKERNSIWDLWKKLDKPILGPNQFGLFYLPFWLF
mgnify:CR=1 FL=1